MMEEVWFFFNHPQVHICLCFEEIKWHAKQQINLHGGNRDGGNDNCFNMPQLALT